MSKFEWQTEQEEWDDLPPVEETRPLALWKRLIIIFVVVIFVGSSALVAIRQIGFRSQRTINEATNDVQDAHNLWRQAVANGDVELLAGLLDQERYPLWAETQVQWVTLGYPPVERSAYGFLLADDSWKDDFAAAAQINLASTLSHAEVTFTQTYQITTPSFITQTVVLQHTVAYHYRNGQWLAGPLANTAWGTSLSYRLPHLTIRYPERDETIVMRLMNDWNRLLQQLCNDAPPFRCGRDYTLSIELSSAPNAMYTSLTGIEFTVVPGQRLYAFSTPTYLGIPADDAGYEAVCRAYSRILAQQILTDIQQTSPLPEVKIPAWVENHLSDLGLATGLTPHFAFPGNPVPMPDVRLTPVCVPYAGQIAQVP